MKFVTLSPRRAWSVKQALYARAARFAHGMLRHYGDSSPREMLEMAWRRGYDAAINDLRREMRK